MPAYPSPFANAPLLGIADAPWFATKYYDPTRVDPQTFKHLVAHDHGLALRKKNSLLTILDSPEWVDHLFVGAAGAAISKATASYLGMSKPAQTLMSLAGFGLGNVIYNQLHENKHTSYNQETGRSRIYM
jgi:hypothetical protein